MDQTFATESLLAKLDEDSHLVWTQADALELCVLLEQLAPEFGAHVALTGGCLYKDGRRKDADFLFYRIRQLPHINERGLLKALIERMGMKILRRHGWVVKAEFDGKPIDLFFPEENKQQQALAGGCTHRIYADWAENWKATERITCPMCYNVLEYSVVHDAWIHPGAPEPTPEMLHVATCIYCNGSYVYDDGDPKYCPKCQSVNLENGNRFTATNATQIISAGTGIAPGISGKPVQVTILDEY